MMNRLKIVPRVLGGLGNQLFVYAHARTLGLKHNVPVKFDLSSGFVRDSYKRIPLLAKCINNLQTASNYDLFMFYCTKKFPFLAFKTFGGIVIFEKDFRKFEDVYLSIPTRASIAFTEGYFQSYKYFAGFEAQIRAEIKLKPITSEEVASIKNEICKRKSVSIHVRRIQYTHLLNLDYYLKAIEIIKAREDSPSFYIFSDNIEWCKENFENLGSFNYVTYDNPQDLTDMYLMSCCKHHIIANSSFSWWGAWLAEPYPNKITIAPKETQIGVKNEFYPENWIKI